MNDFSRTTIARLSRKGIRVVGLQAIPCEDGGFAISQRGYRVDDNGTGRVWTFNQVMEAV